MKKSFLIGLIILAGIIFIPFFVYLAQSRKNLPEATAPENQAKVFKIGSRWLYQTNEATVTVEIVSLKKVGKEKAFVYEYKLAKRKTRPQGSYYIHNEKGLWLAGAFVGANSLTYNPPITIFKNPLKIGSYWQTIYERSDMPGVKFVYKSKINRFFKGKVPAGEFDSYLIEQSTYPLSQPDRTFRKADWFSPEVGIIYHTSRGEMSNTQSSLIDYKLRY